MAPKRYPSQSDIFYDKYWTDYAELCFVMKLEEESTRLGHPLNRQSSVSIHRAMKDVNTEFETIFTAEYCLGRFQKLEDRYRTFSEIITMPEVIYNAQTNVIHADDEIWDKICMAKELGVAYRDQGDPCWEYLQRIFGQPINYDLQNPHSVINISSDNTGSRPPTRGRRRVTSNQTATSGTMGFQTGNMSGPSSTGRSSFRHGRMRNFCASSSGGGDNPSSQASNSFQDASAEF